MVQAEKALLEKYGREVVLLQADNDNITDFFNKTMTALGTLYSFSAKKRVQAEIAKFQPDVRHYTLNNTKNTLSTWYDEFIGDYSSPLLVESSMQILTVASIS